MPAQKTRRRKSPPRGSKVWVVLTHFAHHHRTHRKPLHRMRYGLDLVVEQHNGLYDSQKQAAREARRLSLRQRRSGWVGIYHVPVLTGAAGGWDPRRRIMEQVKPDATYFHGCAVRWEHGGTDGGREVPSYGWPSLAQPLPKRKFI